MTLATCESDLKNSFRCYRVDDNCFGWIVQVTTGGKRTTHYFADSHYGSAAHAKEAAEIVASAEAELQKELKTLHSQFVIRRNSRSGEPGIARYEGDGRRGPFWCAFWKCERSSRRITKRFAVEQLGENAAKQAAYQARAAATEERRRRYHELLAHFGLQADS